MNLHAPRFARLLVRFSLVGLVAAGLAIPTGCSGTKKTQGATDGLTGSPRTASAQVPVYTEADRSLDLESFDYVWTTIRDKHYDPAMGGIDWTAVRDELRPQVIAAASRDEARAVMMRLAHRLGKSHFNIVSSAAYADEDEDVVTNATASAPAAGSAGESEGTSGLKSGSNTDASKASKPKTKPARNRLGDGSAGLDVRIVDGAAMITDVIPGSAADVAGVRPGWLITNVDGADIPARIKRLNESLPESTSRAFYLAEAVAGSLAGDVGDTISIDFLDATDTRVNKQVVLAPMEGTKAQFGNLPTLYVLTRSQRLTGEVHYFKLNIFFDPPGVMNSLTNAVKEAQSYDAKGFIIDLRGNPGGIGAMAMGLAGWFIQEKDQKLGTMFLRNGTMNFLVNPRLRNYAGPLAVLVDGMSGSTSEIFAAGMQDLKRARIFGTRTAGAALPSTFEVLPNQDRFQYAIADYASVGGATIEGNGVIPDQVVELDRASLLAGRDPVIDAAIEWIQSADNEPKTAAPALSDQRPPQR